MSLHYGPKWCWNQNRPEAILARAQMAEFHKELHDRQRRRQTMKETQEILESSPTKHFLLGVKYLGMSLILLLRSLKSLTTFFGLSQSGQQKGRCA